MKALSLTRPWATLAALGEKQWETRSRRFHHYGLTAIHSSDGFPTNLLETYPGGLAQVCAIPHFKEALERLGYTSIDLLPVSSILGFVYISRYSRTETVRENLTAKELAFGLYTNGRWAYELKHPQPLIRPVPCSGRLGLWEVPRDLMDEIRAENPHLVTRAPFSLPI